MNSISRSIVIGFLIAALAGRGIAGKANRDLYVSTAGDDSNPGTIEKPFRTIQHAADRAKPGATISVRGGIYCQQLTVKASGNAREGFITFQSQPGAPPFAIFERWAALTNSQQSPARARILRGDLLRKFPPGAIKGGVRQWQR